MNKENYKRALSGVRPSDEAMERILEIPMKKSIKFKVKPFLAVAAVSATLLAGTLSATAATGTPSKNSAIEPTQANTEEKYIYTVEKINESGKVYDVETIKLNSVNAEELANIMKEIAKDSSGTVDICCYDLHGEITAGVSVKRASE